MKHCSYCNTDYERTINKCPSCQAVDYENRCVGCTTVFSSEHCPKCGLGVNEALMLCPKCGKRMDGSECYDCEEIEARKAEAQARKADAEARVAFGEQEYERNKKMLKKSIIVPTGACLIFHSWSGCVCTTCGKRNYDVPCDWLGCTCKKCGAARNSNHSYYPTSVNGTIERCIICGKTREKKIKVVKPVDIVKERSKLIIALLITLPPVGVLLMWILKNDWEQIKKRNISIGSGIWFLIAVIISIIVPGLLFLFILANAIVFFFLVMPAIGKLNI